MDLAKLFETQKILRDRIKYEGADRFEKLVLSLLVEIGECANEWRGFKFWSKDQEPRTKVVTKGWYEGFQYHEEFKNPLLEEFVDGLHFVMDIGLERGIENMGYAVYISDSIEKQFLYLYQEVSKLSLRFRHHDYRTTFQLFLGLGEMLGFTWIEIEQAYYEKNKINHQRQEQGY